MRLQRSPLALSRWTHHCLPAASVIGPEMLPEGGTLVTNLAINLSDAARQYPGRPAVRLNDEVLSYAELDGRTAQVAGWLRERGLGPATGWASCCRTFSLSRCCTTECYGPVAWWYR